MPLYNGGEERIRTSEGEHPLNTLAGCRIRPTLPPHHIKRSLTLTATGNRYPNLLSKLPVPSRRIYSTEHTHLKYITSVKTPITEDFIPIVFATTTQAKL